MSTSPLRENDKIFFRRIVDNAVDSGLITKPSGGSTRVIRQNSDGAGVGTYVCCFSLSSGRGHRHGRRDDDKQTALVIAIIAFVFSFFVGFYYTVKASKSAAQAGRDLGKLRRIAKEYSNKGQLTQPLPAYTPNPLNHHMPVPNSYGHPVAPYPSYTPYLAYTPDFREASFQHSNPIPPATLSPAIPPMYPPSYNPEWQKDNAEAASDVLNFSPTDRVYVLEQESNPLFDHAATLLKGHRNERTLTAISRGMMTAGSGMVTVALLICLLIEPEILTIAIGAGGVGFILSGLAFWGFISCSLSNNDEQEAADKILALLSA